MVQPRQAYQAKAGRRVSAVTRAPIPALTAACRSAAMNRSASVPSATRKLCDLRGAGSSRTIPLLSDGRVRSHVQAERGQAAKHPGVRYAALPLDRLDAQLQRAGGHVDGYLFALDPVHQRLAHGRKDRDLARLRIHFARADELVGRLRIRTQVQHDDVAADARGARRGALHDHRVPQLLLDAANARLDVGLLLARGVERRVFAEVLVRHRLLKLESDLGAAVLELRQLALQRL